MWAFKRDGAALTGWPCSAVITDAIPSGIGYLRSVKVNSDQDEAQSFGAERDLVFSGARTRAEMTGMS